MLGIYEKRHFDKGEKVWIRRYRNLANALHWHFECEVIRLVEGTAQIRIGDFCFEAVKGDGFFCSGGELHYMIGTPDTQIEVMIFSRDIAEDITDKYSIISPKLPAEFPLKEYFEDIKKELSQKGKFYREAVATRARGMVIDIFKNSSTLKRNDKTNIYKFLIDKINDEFAFITFEDAVHYSGYSPSHFSKMFKKLCGMTFSEYLNIVKVEKAIMLLHGNNNFTITSVSLQCGFSTVRNFNRVFKNITGYSPRLLPKDFIIDTGLRISKNDSFDPTNQVSVLI